jgi:type VI secretion system protein ImpL
MVLWSIIIALFLLIGTWVGGYFLAWALWLKILITVVIVLMVVAAILFRRIRMVMQAKKLERDMLKQAEEQAANARPDRRAEIMELQVQLQRGIASLKASKLGQTGATALYSLPWYLMIGPPGAGKTTALKHSGLAFPFLDPKGGGVRGIGGTRNCDWWFTNEGILLDTAGRYTTEADDHEEWLAFLGMLLKYRSRKPVNGILVAISVTDLMQATEEEIDAQAKRIRSRIDEVMTRLRMVVPIYVVFTKMDLVAGFVEFWNDLRKSERSQPWGVTFPLMGPAQQAAAAQFEDEFDQLALTLHARAVRRIGAERSPDARRAVFHFPLEFQSLRENLSDFVTSLFAPNAFQETPILRGVYFTSGTQEGSPIDRVIGGMLRVFNIGSAQQIQPPQQTTESKSYFVTDLFRRIVFPDQNYAGRTKGELRRQLVNRIAFAVAALLLASILVLPSGCTFLKNRMLLAQTEQIAAETSKVMWSDRSVSIVDKVRHLDDLRAQVKQLDQWKQEGAPIGYRWGMYVGDDLYEPTRGVYISNLQVGFAGPTKMRLEEELRAIVDKPSLTPDEYNAYFNRLKAYLQACDVDRLEVDWETGALTDGWGRALGATGKPEKDVLRPHVNYYLELMKRKEIPPWTCDDQLKNRVRSFLKRVSAADREYSGLLRDANENVPPITRESIFLNTAFGSYVTSKSSPEIVVTGAFTKIGWETYVRDRLGKDRAKQLALERWVLGETDPIGLAQMEKQLAELRERYFNNYIRAWADFLKDLDIRKPSSNDEALEELQALSEVPWPYLRLERILAENTKLDPSATEFAEQQVERNLRQSVAQNSPTYAILADAGLIDPIPVRTPMPPEIAFQPMVRFGVPVGPIDPNKPPATQLAHYQDRIVANVVAVLTDLRDSKGKGVDPKNVTLAFENAIRTTNELLSPTQSGFTRPILSPLLLNPLEMAWAGYKKDAVGTEGGNWESAVWSKWHSKLEDGYPFADTWKDVKVSDYTEFFRPGNGLLFGFYESNLKGSIELAGDHFIPSTRFGHTPSYSGGFLKCYDRGLEISKATFPPKSENPLVEFEINLHSVSENIAEVTFDINGASHTYKNEPEEWVQVQWPAKDPKGQQSRVKIHGYSSLDEEILRPGEWGFFRLLDAASKIENGTEAGKRGAPATIVVTWVLRSQQGVVKMDIRPSKDESVFPSYLLRKQRIFKPYQCPRVIAYGVR